MHFAVRWIHVFSMSLLVGGAALMYITCHLAKSEPLIDRSLLRLLYGYEIVFWVAIGLMVMSGIGNLGTFGNALPNLQTAWGMKLLIKLILVVTLTLCALVRTFVVYRISLADVCNRSISWLQVMERFYVATLLLLAVILTFALGLAHG